MLVALAAGMLVMTGLAGCSSSDNEPAAANSAEVAVPDNAPAPTPPAPEVENTTENMSNAAEIPPEKPIAANEQMMDDASATGMTSRVSRDEAAENAQN
jgi:hypothetical protein